MSLRSHDRSLRLPLGENTFDAPKLSSSLSEPNGLGTNRSMEPPEDSLNILRFDGQEIKCKICDFDDLGAMGSGEFSVVNCMLYRPISKKVAMKRIRITRDDAEQPRSCRELSEFRTLSALNHANVIPFYGMLKDEGDYCVFMELLDVCLKRFYEFVYNAQTSCIPENILHHIVVATVEALAYLKSQLIIHRDVKPSNILVSRNGNTKLCDFGICGILVNSVVSSNVGCNAYLAPERIKRKCKEYDVRSDVWSLGLTLFEISAGKFPYPAHMGIFEQINLVVVKDPPQLDVSRLSKDYRTFVNELLTKSYSSRPKYDRIRKMAFYERVSGQVATATARQERTDYYVSVIDGMASSGELKSF